MYFTDIFASIAILLLLVLLYYEFRRDLMMFQQNSYRPERYKRWLKKSGDSTSINRLVGIFIAFFSLASFGVIRFVLLIFIVYALITTSIYSRRKYKKPLVTTNRVKRLWFAITGLVLAVEGVIITLSIVGVFGARLPLYSAAVTLLFIFCFSHILIFAAYYLTVPFENRINRKFYNLAKSKLEEMTELKIIGITGSYGKTSTKHYLNRILSEHFETLMTPGSFNTTLGVVRTVNEYLKPYHEVFISEMGAKQPGDIKEICDLVHPRIGVVTAVGPQHLETFKTIDNVRATKFELVDSLPKSGYAVLNNDYPEIAATDVHNCNAIRYSCEKDNTQVSFYAFDIKYVLRGTEFKLRIPSGEIIEFETKLLGNYNISNLTAAIAVALLLEMPIDKIRYAVSQIEPVEHRLSIKRLPSGVTLIDDAFNSNPAGSEMAVEVLSNISTNRAIIITPGMIELGDRQYELNMKLGEIIAKNQIDYAAIVGDYNKEALTEGLKAGGMNPDSILYFNTFLEANAWMVSFCTKGDVVLIENDLPDTFK